MVNWEGRKKSGIHLGVHRIVSAAAEIHTGYLQNTRGMCYCCVDVLAFVYSIWNYFYTHVYKMCFFLCFNMSLSWWLNDHVYPGVYLC
jgi:hypothetical protein